MSFKKVIIIICGLISSNYLCEKIFSMNHQKEKTDNLKIETTKSAPLQIFSIAPEKTLKNRIMNILDEYTKSIIDTSEGKIDISHATGTKKDILPNKPFICVDDMSFGLCTGSFNGNGNLIGLILLRFGMIQKEAVVNCPNLRFVIIGDGINTHRGAFQNCSNLEFVLHIGGKQNGKKPITEICTGTFWDCPSIESVFFNNNLTVFRVPVNNNFIMNDIVIMSNLEQIISKLRNLKSIIIDQNI